MQKIEKISLNYRYLLPELVPWLTISGSNYPCLERISMVPKMVEPLRFDCRYILCYRLMLAIEDAHECNVTPVNFHLLNCVAISVFKCLVANKIITKTRLFNYIEILTTKNWKFSDKIADIFQISAQNIDCGYSLEPPRRGGSSARRF